MTTESTVAQVRSKVYVAKTTSRKI